MNETREPTHFSKGVNDYLNSSVTIADAKAAAFLAASVAVGAGALQIQTTNETAAWVRHIAVVSLAISVALNAAVLFPRLPSARRGLVFWEDIRTHTDVYAYVERARQLTDSEIEVEYAAQNYFVSDVLRRKHAWIRRGVGCFLVGVGLAIAAQILK